MEDLFDLDSSDSNVRETALISQVKSSIERFYVRQRREMIDDNNDPGSLKNRVSMLEQGMVTRYLDEV